MTRIAIHILVGIAAGVLAMPVAANEQLPRHDLIDLKMIPGATAVGWVEVMRQNNSGNPGWYCSEYSGHLYALHRLREGRAPIPPEIADKGHQAILSYQLQQGLEPEVNDAVWNQVLGVYLVRRLTLLSEGGKPEKRMPKPLLTWTDWLRQTLENVYTKAVRAGMSEARAEKALHDWIKCHISVDQAVRIRKVIYDNNLHK